MAINLAGLAIISPFWKNTFFVENLTAVISKGVRHSNSSVNRQFQRKYFLGSECTERHLKKEQQCSYWGAQNLSEAQKTYAANDVIYLHDIRNALNKILEKYNRTEIANKFFQFLNNICTADLLDFNEDIFRHTDRDFKN